MGPIIPAWGVLGLFAGIWKLAIVAGVILVVLGRSRSRLGPWIRLLKPWTESPTNKRTAIDRATSRGSRLYWSLTIVAAAAVAAWIATSLTIRSANRR